MDIDKMQGDNFDEKLQFQLMLEQGMNEDESGSMESMMDEKRKAMRHLLRMEGNELKEEYARRNNLKKILIKDYYYETYKRCYFEVIDADDIKLFLESSDYNENKGYEQGKHEDFYLYDVDIDRYILIIEMMVVDVFGDDNNRVYLYRPWPEWVKKLIDKE